MIKLNYRGWEFEFEQMPTSDELAQRYQARVGRTEISLPVPVPVPLERDAGPYRPNDLGGRIVVVTSRPSSSLLVPLVQMLADRGARVGLSQACAEALPSSLSSHAIDRAELDSDVYGLVFDLTDSSSFEVLDTLCFETKATLPSMSRSGRLVVVTRPTSEARTAEQAALWRGADGFIKTSAREFGPRGITTNRVVIESDAYREAIGPLRFLLSPRSVYVSSQIFEVRPTEHYPDSMSTSRVLESKTALVTGAARGIGRATAVQLAQEGAKVICVDLPEGNPYNEPGSAELLAELESEIGAVTCLLNIAADDAPARMGELVREVGGLDILVNNAAIVSDNMIATMQEESWQNVLSVNLGSPFRTTDYFLEQDLIRNLGRVIFVGSVAGIAGNFGQSAYSSSKSGLLGLAEHYSRRHSERGITFNTVVPGTTRTRLLDKPIPQWMVDAGCRLNAMSQEGHPSDPANAIVFFATDESQGVNGTWLRVCGAALQGA